MKKVVFLDRDGVINEDHDYVYKIEDFVFKREIFPFVGKLRELGFDFVVVTNQSGIGRGYYTLDQFYTLDSWMHEEFKNSGTPLLKTYFCPHTPNDMCNCRKPKPGLLERAQREFDIDMRHSFLIGDKVSDINAGLNAELQNNILFKGKAGEDYNFDKASFVSGNFDDIYEYIKETSSLISTK